MHARLTRTLRGSAPCYLIRRAGTIFIGAFDTRPCLGALFILFKAAARNNGIVKMFVFAGTHALRKRFADGREAEGTLSIIQSVRGKCKLLIFHG